MLTISILCRRIQRKRMSKKTKLKKQALYQGVKKRVTQTIKIKHNKRPNKVIKESNKQRITRFFYKKLGSAPSIKSFLISHENFAIIVLKVS